MYIFGWAPEFLFEVLVKSTIGPSLDIDGAHIEEGGSRLVNVIRIILLIIDGQL